jgi:hypothetical protein
MKIKFKLWFIGCIFYAVIGSAQIDYDIVPDVSDVILLNDIQLVNTANVNMGFVDILIEKGMIKAIDGQIDPPFNAYVVEADSGYVYASFIDGFSNTGSPKEKKSSDTPKPKFPGFPIPADAGIQSDRSMADIINFGDDGFEALRQAGFGISHVAPEGRMLPGKSAIVILNGIENQAAVLRKDQGVFFQLFGTRGLYPSTVIGVMAKWKELITQAHYLIEHQNKNTSMPVGTETASYNSILESLIPVSEKQMKVYMNADKIKTVFRGLELQQDLGYKLVLVDIKQGWDAIESIKSHGVEIMLSLSLPKEEKKDKKSKKEKEVSQDEEVIALQKRKEESLAAYKSQASRFEEAKIDFAFSLLSAKAKDVKKNLNEMIKAGLSKQKAMEAMTINAAKIIGIDKIAGSIEKGKMANMFITDKDYFEEDAHIKMNIVQGQIFEFPKKEKPKADAAINTVDDIMGTWSYSAQIENETRTGQLIISNANDNLSVEMISDDNTSVVNVATDISFDEGALTFDMNITEGDMIISVSFSLNFSKEAYSGNADIEGLGNYTISGQKISSPE